MKIIVNVKASRELTEEESTNVSGMKAAELKMHLTHIEAEVRRMLRARGGILSTSDIDVTSQIVEGAPDDPVVYGLDPANGALCFIPTGGIPEPPEPHRSMARYCSHGMHLGAPCTNCDKYS